MRYFCIEFLNKIGFYLKIIITQQKKFYLTNRLIMLFNRIVAIFCVYKINTRCFYIIKQLSLSRDKHISLEWSRLT